MRPKKSVYFFAIATLPLLFFLQNPSISKPIREVSQTFLKPLFSLGHLTVQGIREGQAGFSRFIKSFKDQEIYTQRIAQLESQLVRLGELEKENHRLRDLLAFQKTTSSKSIGARVIGWDPSPWRKTLLLNKGKNEGIRQDMAVVVQDGLVGRVIEVFANSSRVLLLIDPDARVSTIANESRAQGVTQGDGTSRLAMSYLELDSGVAVGEKVLTSGVGGLFPKGVAVGRILSLGRDTTGLHLRAEIEPFVNFSKLEEVLCLE